MWVHVKLPFYHPCSRDTFRTTPGRGSVPKWPEAREPRVSVKLENSTSWPPLMTIVVNSPSRRRGGSLTKWMRRAQRMRSAMKAQASSIERIGASLESLPCGMPKLFVSPMRRCVVGRALGIIPEIRISTLQTSEALSPRFIRGESLPCQLE